MPTLNDIKQTVNNWLAARWPTLVSRQEMFFASHERYFQGLWTHNTAPADGTETEPDNLTAQPTDQQASWPDFIVLPTTLPCALRIDVYEAAAGYGWTATLRVQVAGTIYERRANVGPESWRVFDWRPVEQPAVEEV